MKKPDLPQWVDAPCWRLSPPRDFCEFLRELPKFVPEGSILCLEGGDAYDVDEYLAARPAIYENETDQGWLRHRPKVFYIPITEANLIGLGDLSERHAEPEVANSISVYRDDQIIMSWHDLPFDPIYVSTQFDEQKLKKLGDVLGCESLSYAATEKEK